MSEAKTEPGAEALHDAGQSPRRWWLRALLLAVALALCAAAWMLWQSEPKRGAGTVVTQAPPAGMRPPASTAPDTSPGAASGASSAAGAPGAAAGTSGAGPARAGASGQARYPVESALGGEGPVDPAMEKLERPAAEKALAQALAALPNKDLLLRFLLPSDLVKRFVLTVDNLPGEAMSMQYRAIVATPGAFLTEARGGEVLIAAQNQRRYDAFVKMALSLDSRRLVALYKRFYPLFQQEFRAIGYPDGYFNDRVVQAIDDMLAAPTVANTPGLAQPKVLYEYADPSLERRSVGQKMLIRMGPEHAAQLKSKLREFRQALTNEPK